MNFTLILLIASVLSSGNCFQTNEIDKKQQTKNNSMVIAHLNEKVEFNQNIVFCSSFLVAWKELRELLGEDIKLTEPVSLTSQLNNYSDLAAIIPGMISYGEFIGDDSILCHASLHKQFEFKTPFSIVKMPYGFKTANENNPVHLFGFTNNNEKIEKINQNTDLFIFDQDGFAVKIKNKQLDEEIVIARVSQDGTMERTINKTEELLNETQSQHFINSDNLVIPFVELDLQKTYAELLGKHLANKTYEEFFFVKADQEISFKMNNRGASVNSESTLVITKGNRGRNFIFNTPFLIYVKNIETNQIYLAAWISNNEFFASR